MAIIVSFILLLVQILTFAIIGRAILSWFPISPHNALAVFLFNITEPILAPLRRVIPRVGMLDITPLVAILILQFIPVLIIRLLF
ncbi:MAG: YggT family protein [Dehalococcoidia bacterium]